MLGRAWFDVHLVKPEEQDFMLGRVDSLQRLVEQNISIPTCPRTSMKGNNVQLGTPYVIKLPVSGLELSTSNSKPETERWISNLPCKKQPFLRRTRDRCQALHPPQCNRKPCKYNSLPQHFSPNPPGLFCKGYGGPSLPHLQ